MNKLEVGMWVRNCYGRIAKIDYIEDNVAYCDNWLYQQYEDHITFINTDSEDELNEIINASYNLLALIEVGDIINKKEVVKIIHFEGDTFYRIQLFGGKAIMNSKDIKSIVTKEQFESMSYKVGEE